MRRRPARVGATAPLLLLLLLGCDAGASRPPDLVLVVVDTLRADHLGAYGYDRPTSPELDALAARGTLFANATAPSSWTRPSMASLFTSRLPSEHGAVSSLAPLAPEISTLAERLHAAGYRTVGVSGNFPHVNEKSGLSRGFEEFLSLAMPARDDDDTLMRLSLREGAKPASLRAPTAGELNERVLEALSASDDERPLFLYVHYMDPHSGYLAPASFQARFRTRDAGAPPLPAATSDHVVELAAGRVAPEPGEGRHLVDLYDAEIAYVDAEIGKLLGVLEREGGLRDPVVVVLADHGEEFADHSGWFHGLTLYGETLRVPLVIVGASGLAPGVREDPVELLDVPTTLLALAGVPPDEGMRGRDLRDPGAPGPRIAELHPDPVREGKAGALRHRAAIDQWPYKALVDPSGGVTVYDLEQDPVEHAPIAPLDPALPSGLVAQARERAERVDATGADTERGLDPDEREALRALGYAE